MKKLLVILMFSSLMSMAADTTAVLPYLVREPKIKVLHPPVIFLLHGFGSNEADLFSLANQLPNKYLIISARAPIRLAENSFAWYRVDFSSGKPVYDFKEAESSQATLINFIKQINEKYKVSKEQVYLCGFSQGGIMSYSVGLTQPNLIKGIVVMSGRLLEEIKPKIEAPSQLKNLKVLITHGTDDKTLPLPYATQAAAYLKSLHIATSFKMYPARHEINNSMLADIVQWLK
jgi:phospholipase/carboxylesterase